MLDQYSYRKEEALFKEGNTDSRMFDPIVFENVGFPIRVSNINDIGQLLDTMQENRFDGYMQELGGLSPFEYDLMLNACYSSVMFQLNYLPHQLPILPLSTLLSSFCIYKKLRGINPMFESVLEIGPGCGYLSLFLSQRTHKPLKYVQIETCESFYLLQNLINTHCFGADFDELALLPRAVKYNWRSDSEHIEEPHFVNVPHNPRCIHVPWWSIKNLYNFKFQIVTANAAFSEFSDAALEEYLRLIDIVLEPDGFILAQCLGCGGPRAELFDKFDKAGFALLAKPTLPNDITNAIWCRAGVHDYDVVNRVFFRRPENRKIYTIEEFVVATEELFK